MKAAKGGLGASGQKLAMDENPYKAPSVQPETLPPLGNPYRLKLQDALAMGLVAVALSTILYAMLRGFAMLSN